MRVLAIDDNRDNLLTLRAIVSDGLPDTSVITASNGRDGLELAKAEDPDVILLDIVMPGMDGYTVCEQLKNDEILRDIPVIFVTALRADAEHRRRALKAGAEGFLAKPIDEIELIAQVRAMVKIKALNRLRRLDKDELAALVAERTSELEHELEERRRLEARMREMAEAVIDVVGEVSDMRDSYSGRHQRRVAELSKRIALEIGLSDADIDDIRLAGLMHDIGMMAVPGELLSKPGALSRDEFSLVKEHARAGFTLVESSHMREPIPEMVYQHHERCDGSGYPRGLAGDDILTGSKVLMVADVVEAMTALRPYRPAHDQATALEEIERGAGTLYDPRVVECCIRLFRERAFEISA